MAPPRPRRERLPGWKGVLAVATVLVLVPVVLTGFLGDLPGPRIRVLLGLADERTADEACVPGPTRMREPDAPTEGPGLWRAEPRSPLAREEVEAVTIGGRIHVLTGVVDGGVPVDATLVFDPDRRRWNWGPPAPVPLHHALAVAHGDDLILAGGYRDITPSARAWRFSPRTGRWTELARMSQARGSPGGAVIGDRLYVAGGAPSIYLDEHVRPYRSLEVLDLRTGRWSAGPDIPTARHHLGAAALGGRLYVVGGREPGDFALSTFERFDPTTGAWERLPPLPQGASGLELVPFGDELIAVGGGDDQDWSNGGGWVTPATWAYSPERRRWRRLADLATPRHGHAVAVAGDRVYAFEGAPCPGPGFLHTVESIRVPPLAGRAAGT